MAGLVLVAMLAVAWVTTADLGFLKPRIEAALTELSGRRFEIRGGLSIDVGRRIAVVARDVHWQNAEWDQPDEMLAVAYAEIHIDLRSLINGPLRVEYVEVRDADLVVTVLDGGRLNWDVFGASAEPAPADAAPGGGFLLKQANIQDVRLVYSSPAQERPVRLAVASLNQRHRDDDVLDLDFKGTLGNRKAEFAGETGPWNAMLSGKDIRFDLRGVFGSLEWAVDGHLDDVTGLRRPTINLVAKAPNIDEIAQMLGMGGDSEGDIDVSAELAPSDDGTLVLDALARVGEVRLEAEGVASDLANLDRIDLDLSASGPNLGRVMAFFGVDDVHEGAFLVDVDATREGKDLIVQQARLALGDTEFLMTAQLPDFPSLNDGTIDLSATGPDIGQFWNLSGLPGVASGPFTVDVDLTVQADGTEHLHLDVATSLGRMTASGQLGEAPAYAGSEFDFTVDSDSLAPIGTAVGIDTLPDAPLSAAGSVVLEEGALRLRTPSAISLGGIDAELEGRVAFAAGGEGSSLDVSVRGPSLKSAVAGFAQAGFVPDQPFDAAANVAVQRSAIDVRDARIGIGSTDLSVVGRLSLAPGLAGTRVRLLAEGPAMEELLADVDGYSVRPGPFSLSGRVELERTQLSVDDFELSRGNGTLTADVAVGWPIESRFVDFSASASGRDVRNAAQDVAGFKPHEAPFSFKTRGTLRGEELRLDGFSATLGDASLSGEGLIDVGDGLSRTRFSLSGRVPDLARLGTVNGRGFSAQSLAFSLSAIGEDGRLDIGDLVVEMGGSDLTGDLRYVEGDVPKLSGRFSSDAFLIQPLFRDEEIDVEPVAERDDGRLIPDWPLPLEAMRAVDAELYIDIGTFRRGSLYLENVLVDATLYGGALELRELRMNPPSGALVSRGSLVPAEGGARTELDLVARNAAFGLSDTNRDLARTADVDVSLAFVGDDLRSMLATSSGTLLLDMRGGRVGSNTLLNALYGDVLQQILSVISPFYKAETSTELSCLVAPLGITAGKLDAVPRLIVRTDKLNVFVKPSINLGNEKLDVSVRTTPRKGISISTAELFNPYVKIVGSLGSPALAVDEQGVLISGGAAVATGGLSILAKAAWDRIGRSGNPCDATREVALEAFAGRMPDLVIEEDAAPAEPNAGGGSP